MLNKGNNNINKKIKEYTMAETKTSKKTNDSKLDEAVIKIIIKKQYKSFLENIKTETISFCAECLVLSNQIYEPIIFSYKIKGIKLSDEDIKNKYGEDIEKIADLGINKKNIPNGGLAIGLPKEYSRFVYLKDDKVSSKLLDLNLLTSIFKQIGIDFCINYDTDTLIFNLNPTNNKSFNLS